jgi:hypothetical protein
VAATALQKAEGALLYCQGQGLVGQIGEPKDRCRCLHHRNPQGRPVRTRHDRQELFIQLQRQLGVEKTMGRWKIGN